MTTQRPPYKRGTGFHSIEAIRSHCTIDPQTHCWNWLGAKSSTGSPRVWAIDLRRMEKRCMEGPLALWMVAHGEPPNGIPFRRCLNRSCMNPAHLHRANNRADLTRILAATGMFRTPKNIAVRQANAAIARAKSGMVDTPDDVVRQIRSSDPSRTGLSLAREFGLSETTVQRIRRRETRASVPDAA